MKKAAILIGAGARGGADDVLETADRLGAGVTKALLGKDVLPDDLPFVTGDAIVTSDSGSCANRYARTFAFSAAIGLLSGGLASMGAAVPYAIAA
jgi:thiamine pyrophosphate-dependent acetolactate synthase large subunit-like protein